MLGSNPALVWADLGPAAAGTHWLAGAGGPGDDGHHCEAEPLKPQTPNRLFHHSDVCVTLPEHEHLPGSPNYRVPIRTPTSLHQGRIRRDSRVRPHGKWKVDAARKPSFAVMAKESDWINRRRNPKPAGRCEERQETGFGSSKSWRRAAGLVLLQLSCCWWCWFQSFPEERLGLATAQPGCVRRSVVRVCWF